MKEGDLVMVRDFHTKKTWLAGTLRQSQGPLSFNVELEDGRILRRHVDHIRLRQETSSTDSKEREVDLDDFEAPIPENAENPMEENTPSEQPQEPPALRRSDRIRQPPIRYEPHFHLTQPNPEEGGM